MIARDAYADTRCYYYAMLRYARALCRCYYVDALIRCYARDIHDLRAALPRIITARMPHRRV